MTKRILETLVGLVVLAGVPASSAHAETVSRKVSIAGLDLSKPTDLATVQKRIRRAAWSICKPGPMFVPLAVGLESRRCVRGAIASAQPQLDRAVSTAMARRRLDNIDLASRR